MKPCYEDNVVELLIVWNRCQRASSSRAFVSSTVRLTQNAFTHSTTPHSEPLAGERPATTPRFVSLGDRVSAHTLPDSISGILGRPARGQDLGLNVHKRVCKQKARGKVARFDSRTDAGFHISNVVSHVPTQTTFVQQRYFD